MVEPDSLIQEYYLSNAGLLYPLDSYSAKKYISCRLKYSRKEAFVFHWNPKVITMPTLSSLKALQVVIMTTSGAVSDDEVGIVITFGFQCIIVGLGLTLKQLGHIFKSFLFSNVIHYKCNISVWNWSNMIYSALWLQMAWRFSTRASVATVLCMYPCISSCLWVNFSGTCIIHGNHIKK